jgi:hypothetical protein
MWFHPISNYRIHVLTFVYNGFKILFVNSLMMFARLKSK